VLTHFGRYPGGSASGDPKRSKRCATPSSPSDSKHPVGGGTCEEQVRLSQVTRSISARLRRTPPPTLRRSWVRTAISSPAPGSGMPVFCGTRRRRSSRVRLAVGGQRVDRRDGARDQAWPRRGIYLELCDRSPLPAEGFFRAIVRGIVDQVRNEDWRGWWIGTLDIPPRRL